MSRWSELTVEQRFWLKVNIRGEGDCWIWLPSRNNHRYGRFGKDHKIEKAHRVAYILTKGDIPDGLEVCHSCNNKICCNPAHLYLDTHRGNMIAAARDGLMSRGSHHHSVNTSSILTESDIPDIRRMHTDGYSLRKIAYRFGVSHETIRNVVSGRSWSHVK